MTTLSPMGQDDGAMRIRLELADLPLPATQDDLLAYLVAHQARAWSL